MHFHLSYTKSIEIRLALIRKATTNLGQQRAADVHIMRIDLLAQNELYNAYLVTRW